MEHEVAHRLMIVFGNEIATAQLKQFSGEFALDLSTQMARVDFQIREEVIAPQNASRLLDIEELERKCVGRVGELLRGEEQRRGMAEAAPFLHGRAGSVERGDVDAVRD